MAADTDAFDALHTIAKRVGVSANTVLRVLRGENKEVWAGTAQRAQRIRDLAHELGYRPHGSARAMRRGRFDTLALLLSADLGRSHLPEDLLNGIADACDAGRQRLTVAKVSDDRLTDPQLLPRILGESSSDGLLINYTDRIPVAMPQLVERCRLPAIWINSKHAHDAIWYDDFGGAAAATRQLLQLGHRRIGWLDFVGSSESDPHYSRVERAQGVTQTLATAGQSGCDLGHLHGVPVDDRLAASIALLRRPDRPTAIIAYDGGERLLYAAALAGLRVPQDLSLIVYASALGTDRRAEQQNHFGRRLTTLAIPGAEAGRQAVAMLLEKIEQGGTALTPRILPVPIEAGDTIGIAP
jgi:DNA-binding LacI/PurR family transcriptional regulator